MNLLAPAVPVIYLLMAAMFPEMLKVLAVVGQCSAMLVGVMKVVKSIVDRCSEMHGLLYSTSDMLKILAVVGPSSAVFVGMMKEVEVEVVVVGPRLLYRTSEMLKMLAVAVAVLAGMMKMVEVVVDCFSGSH